jgi:hypothetical protein
MDARTATLLIALLISLGFNILTWLENPQETVLTQSGICNANRYHHEVPGGGRSIEKDYAKDLIYRFRELHNSDDSLTYTTGWRISFRALTTIFDDTLINALAMDLVQDNDKLKLILSGVTTDSTEIESKVESGIFVTQSMCPSFCTQW